MSIEVHIDWQGATTLVGRLHPSPRSPAVGFEYDRTWLSRPNAFAIDPNALPLRPGPVHAPALFGAMQDCGPDRWGRVLVERAVRKGLREARPYQGLDYVLALDDFSRIGALRFRSKENGPFLAESSGRLPPIIRLGTLMAAADAISRATETAQDLRLLLGVGSPLGGARPKSAVEMKDGTLAIAKFPKPDDRRSIAAGEILALSMARRAGLRTADHELIRVDSRQVSLIRRFDRAKGMRIPFISAHTLLGLRPGEDGSYVRLAEGIRQFGDNVRKDLPEIWARAAFALLISNHDDHLRNHGFLAIAPGRWALSPAYDLNPVPLLDQVTAPQTPLGDSTVPQTVEGALSIASHFGMDAARARKRMGEIAAVAADWRGCGRRLGLTAKQLAAYESAFDPKRIEEAQMAGKRSVAVKAAMADRPVKQARAT